MKSLIKVTETLRSRGAAQVFLCALGLFALGGAFAPEDLAPALFSGWVFFLLLAVFTAGLSGALFRWAASLRGTAAWGRFLLHAGVLLVIAGAAFNAKLSREWLLEVIEGQALPLPGSDASVRLDRFHPFYRTGGWHKGAAAGLTFFENGSSKPAIVYVNKPAGVGGLSIMLDKHGFAPLLRVSGLSGGPLIDAFVSLKTELGETVSYQRSVNIPGTARWLRLDFKPSAKGYFATDPAVKAALAEDGKILAEGIVRPGRPAVLSGYKVSFDEVRYWAGLQVRKDPALALVYAGFLISMAGASLCFWRILWT